MQAAIGMDLSDVERRVGEWVGGGDLREPASALDIRRWVHAMDYPNPIHWDEAAARASSYRGIVAPQSFVLATDDGHSGIMAALVGHIANAHMMLGSEEWWHSGYRIRPGDKIAQRRRFDGFDVKETAFAGPTVFARGDTFHATASGAPVAHSRTTAVRFSAAEAARRGTKRAAVPPQTDWSADDLARIARIRHDWILSNREGRTPRIGEVAVGDRLPPRATAPVSIAALASEWRAFPFQEWGASRWVRPEGGEASRGDDDPGAIEGHAIDHRGGGIDPRLLDGLYAGPSAAHVDIDKAREIGMPRRFGFGGTTSAWFADYLAYWAGHEGAIRHSRLTLRAPAFEGDAVFTNGEIVEVKPLSPSLGVPLVTIKAQLTNHRGDVLANGVAQVEVGFEKL